MGISGCLQMDADTVVWQEQMEGKDGRENDGR